MEDKKTVITIDIPNSDHLDFTLSFNQDKAHCVWVDWGDDSQSETYENVGFVVASHGYEEPGEYDISMFAVDGGTIKLISVGADDGYKSMITAVTIGDDVTAMSNYIFNNCENIEELEFLGENIEMGEYAFAACISLTEVTLPNGISMLPLGLFFNCSSLKKVILPDDVTVISDIAFYGCSRLKDINIEHAYEIGNYAFCGCKKLTSLVFANSLHGIGNYSFDSCTSLNNISIGNTVETFGNGVFCNCKSLARIIIPSTVSQIGDKCFYNCRFLKEVRVECIQPPVLQSTDVFPNNGDYKILIPDGTLDDYASATNWNIYADRMEEYK